MARSTIVRHETVVGAFTLLCAAILAGGLIIKGAKVGFGSRHLVFVADAGHDLKKGAAVKMQGLEIGEVEEVDLEEAGVHVHLKIYPQFRDFVHTDATVTIDEPPILGSSSVEVHPGSAKVAIEEGK
ncbi:MAG: MlaD family protein, partial [Planctomycetota bacterium]